MSFQITKMNQSQLMTVRHQESLRKYLDSLEQGRKATPHSWLYEDEPGNTAAEKSRNTLKRWMNILKSLERGTDAEKLIYHFDFKQVEKFGPQGEVPPIKEAIEVESFREQYETNSPVTIPLRNLSSILGVNKPLQYWDYSKVIDSMKERDTLETKSGWPFNKVRKRVRPVEEEYARSGACYSFPAMILFRHYNGKLRVVWMYPMSMNLREYTATNPLQDLIQAKTKYVTPWLGFDHVKIRFTELWKQHPYAFGGDTTAMDAHMQLSQLQCVGDMCASLFVDPTSMLQSLKHVAEIDLVVGPESIIKDQQHGIASGSGWTQLSETIFQIGMFDKYCKTAGIHSSIENGMGIGDDYVWFFDNKPDAKSIVSFWERNGLPGKLEKQSNEKDSCTFLQRLFIKGVFSRDDSTVLGGIYPTVRALNSLLNPERFHSPKLWDSNMFCCRTYMILENTVDHPLFEEFCKFVVKGQKDLLPFAKQSESKINSAYSKTRLLPGLNPSYNQEKLTKPMSEFTAIKFVRSL